MNKLLKFLNGRKTILGGVSSLALAAFLSARGLSIESITDAAIWEQITMAILGLLSGTMLPIGLLHKSAKDKIAQATADRCDDLEEILNRVKNITENATAYTAPESLSNVDKLVKDLFAHEREAEERRKSRREMVEEAMGITEEAAQ